MNKIFLLGDIHGMFLPIKQFVNKNKKEVAEGDILILLGDSGINYYRHPNQNRNIKKQLASTPLTYFVVRGNHDQRPSNLAEKYPKDWEITTMFGNTVYIEKKYPNIVYARDDVALYNINGHSTLIIPGAYSVDKYFRVQKGYEWYEDEQLSLEEQEEGLELLESIGWKCDVVLSHTCPAIYTPTDLFLPGLDQSSVDCGTEMYMGKIEYQLDYKLWFWGHYHKYRKYRSLDKGKQQFMLFDDFAVELEDCLQNKGTKMYPAAYRP